MTSPWLAADSVGKSFGGRRVLTSATLRAVPGEVRVLLGRSGEGKTTLLLIAAGWMQADTGIVRLGEEAFLRPSLAKFATRGVFLLPDDGALGHGLTVRRQLEMIRVHFDGGSVVEAAESMGIAPHLDRKPYELSGGERRRADLAAVLVRRPRVLLADEPLRGISPIDAEALMATFRLLAEQGTAVVVTGHDVPMLLAGADHVTWSTAGTTYELGSPEAARRHEGFASGYLGRGHE